MATVRQSRPYSALDLPKPRRVALVFGALAVAGLCLEIDPRLPWLVGLVAAALFAAAGAIRTERELRDLAAVRRTADSLILHTPSSRDASELVRWRCTELTTRSQRERTRRGVARILKALDPGRLPSASPLRRPEARSCRPLLEALASRLADERPVAARGILLAEAILGEPSSPLYSDGPDQNLDRALRRVLGALDP